MTDGYIPAPMLITRQMIKAALRKYEQEADQRHLSRRLATTQTRKKTGGIGEAMTKKEMIKKIIDGEVNCIEQWVFKNQHNDLRAWLRDTLMLDGMTKAELEQEFGAHLEGP